MADPNTPPIVALEPGPVILPHETIARAQLKHHTKLFVPATAYKIPSTDPVVYCYVGWNLASIS
jgi:hypothetical protein